MARTGHTLCSLRNAPIRSSSIFLEQIIELLPPRYNSLIIFLCAEDRHDTVLESLPHREVQRHYEISKCTIAF